MRPNATGKQTNQLNTLVGRARTKEEIDL